MKQVRFFRFTEGRLEEVSAVDPQDGCSYIIVTIVDGIPKQSLIIN